VVKILSQSGNSLADMYDVEGSVAGIEQLETRELPIVHELGATLFSERCSSFIRRFESGAIAQNTAWDVEATDLPGGIFRVLGVSVFATLGARTTQASVALRNDPQDREIPIFVWDTANDVESGLRIANTAAPAQFVALIANANVPNLGVGDGQPQRVSDIAFRGATSAFGAGLVTVTALVHVALSQVGGGGLSNRGIPFPSW